MLVADLPRQDLEITYLSNPSGLAKHVEHVGDWEITTISFSDAPLISATNTSGAIEELNAELNAMQAKIDLATAADKPQWLAKAFAPLGLLLSAAEAANAAASAAGKEASRRRFLMPWAKTK